MCRATAVMVLLVSAACSGTGVDFPPLDEAGSGQESPRDPDVQPGLLDFTAPRLGGGQVTGAELQGKDVAMWFWAPW